MSFLKKLSSANNPEDEHAYIYESQMSFMVTGYNISIWTAYGLVDTFHHAVGDPRDRDSIEYYRDDFNEGNGMNWDPLCAGTRDADCPVADPREYFLLLLNARVQQATEEWLKVVSIIRQNIENHVRWLLTPFVIHLVTQSKAAGIFSVHWSSFD